MIKKLILALAVLVALGAQAQAKRTEFYGQRATLFNILPVDSTNIVMLGNSLTNGGEWAELLGNPKVINRGISGDTTDGIDERLECVVSGKPAKIFLLAGTNDVSHNLSADSVATLTVELVKKIKAATPNTRLYVQSLFPINNSFGRYKLMKDKEQVIRDINALVQPQIEALGCTWINIYPLLCDEEQNLRRDLTNDGLHLLGPGYLIWRDALLPYVNE